MGNIVSFRRAISLCCLTLIVAGILVWLFRDSYVIRFTNRSRDAVFFSKPIRPGDRFTFKHIHSVQKSPVYEVFTIDEEGSIVLLEARTTEVGYGLPEPSEEDTFAVENGFLVIKDLNRKVGKLLIRVNFVRLMELRFKGKAFDLRECGQAGDVIEVSTVHEKRINAVLRKWRRSQ